MLGSPFPPAVYIGHPGWKAAGGRTGYSMGSGVVIAIALLPAACSALLGAMLPNPAIVPILLYIGLLIGAQAFQAVPKRHAVAVVIAIIPNVASWAQGQIDNALAAAGTTARQGRLRQHRGQRHHLQGHHAARRRRGPRGPAARRDHRVPHRP